MRALLPKIVESLAFKGANAFAQTERRGDTELVTYAKVLSYAFIGDFLVLSADAATMRKSRANSASPTNGPASIPAW